MPVKQIPSKFETSDGKEFDTKKEAERHEELIAAKNAYETARYKLGRALARTQRTADGELFDFGVFSDYWYVTPGYWGLPELARVSFTGWNFAIDDGDEAVIKQEENNRQVSYVISELYWDQGKAEIALLAAQEKRLAELAEKVEELRKKLKANQD